LRALADRASSRSAGLSSEERSAVERGFASGSLHTLACTSTLAAGINLPARRCVIRHGAGRMAVPRAQYLQMIGRAGRAGKCAVGESFLVLDWESPNPDNASAKLPRAVQRNEAALAAARKLLGAPMPRLRSHLVPRGWAAATPEQRKCAAAPCCHLMHDQQCRESRGTLHGTYETCHASV
jgi:superfamily II DNA/RNA helicase